MNTEETRQATDEHELTRMKKEKEKQEAV